MNKRILFCLRICILLSKSLLYVCVTSADLIWRLTFDSRAQHQKAPIRAQSTSVYQGTMERQVWMRYHKATTDRREN